MTIQPQKLQEIRTGMESIFCSPVAAFFVIGIEIIFFGRRNTVKLDRDQKQVLTTI